MLNMDFSQKVVVRSAEEAWQLPNGDLVAQPTLESTHAVC